MASIPDWSRYQGLAGNASLTVLVDYAAFRTSVVTCRLETRWNRRLDGVGIDVVRMRFGGLVFEGYFPESVKAGVTIDRPRWRFADDGTTPKVLSTTGGCGGYVRTVTFAFTDPLFLRDGVITYQRLSNPAIAEHVVSTPFSVAAVYRGVGGNLCYPGSMNP